MTIVSVMAFILIILIVFAFAWACFESEPVKSVARENRLKREARGQARLEREARERNLSPGSEGYLDCFVHQGKEVKVITLKAFGPSWRREYLVTFRWGDKEYTVSSDCPYLLHYPAMVVISSVTSLHEVYERIRRRYEHNVMDPR